MDEPTTFNAVLPYTLTPNPPARCPEGVPQFLDTTPFRYDEQLEPAERVAVERHRVVDRRQLVQSLVNLKRLEAPVRIGLPAAGAYFSATLWAVDTQAERMVFHAAREPGVLPIVTDPARLWGAAYEGSCKVQFDLRGRSITTQDDLWVVVSHLPSALYLMPRRTEVRTRHGAGHEPRVHFMHPDRPGQPLYLPIHDISAGGLSILLSPEEGRLKVGQEVHGAEIELAPGEFLFADFRIRNVQLHDEDGGQFRFGCAWELLSAEARRLIERWTQRARQRRQMLSLDL